MKQTICLVAIFSVIAASSAMANQKNKTRVMDKNRDGVVTQSERVGAYDQNMAKYADANRDGVVSDDERSIYFVSLQDQYAAAYQRRDQNYTISQYRNLPDAAMPYYRGDKYLQYAPGNYAPAAGGTMNREYNR